MFKFLGEKVAQFLDYTDNGSRLVFGNSFNDHFFAFKVMAAIIFFSGVVNILYYLKVVQYMLVKCGWLVHVLMGTYPLESANSIATVILGPGETPVII